jgi:tetratricopeptide (TPR) repeat protein
VNGDMPEALVALGRLPAILDPKVIGSELRSDEKFALARGKFQLALTQRDTGKFEESAATLIEAAQEMGQLVMGSSPRNQAQALALAETYTELAEVIGTHFGTADAKEAHNQGVPILLELNRLHPEWAEVKYLLARNYGAVASLERDAGKSSEAVKKKQDAIEFMNEVLADNKDNTRYLFLLAKLHGEYAEMIADLGRTKEAVPIAKQAVASLEKLLGPATGAKLTPERKLWEVQLAQLYGVLGHTSEKANQKDLAKASFTSAAAQWEKLAAANTGDETIQQALNWTKNRLAKLK